MEAKAWSEVMTTETKSEVAFFFMLVAMFLIGALAN